MQVNVINIVPYWRIILPLCVAAKAQFEYFHRPPVRILLFPPPPQIPGRSTPSELCNSLAMRQQQLRKYSKHVDYSYSPSRPMSRPVHHHHHRPRRGSQYYHILNEPDQRGDATTASESPPPQNFIRIKSTYHRPLDYSSLSCFRDEPKRDRALEEISFVGHMVLRGLNWIHFHPWRHRL